MTTVRLANGATYPIPTGAPGSFAWVREAALISVAYQQADDPVNAMAWRREYEKRLVAWRSIEDGRDAESVIKAGSWIQGPQNIVLAAGRTLDTLLQAFEAAARGIGAIPSVLPILAVGLLVVAGIVANRTSVQVRR